VGNLTRTPGKSNDKRFWPHAQSTASITELIREATPDFFRPSTQFVPIPFNMAEVVIDVDNDIDKEWEPYKETIRTLYLVEDRPLEGPRGLINEMKAKFGFDKR
jgi:hypothetical protein